ncbi:hypothetical protein I203_106814 [Kwoniella mangroviensis CBS 8507]|uniref:uncharacterized protein n=1 Tax=Kwoniella mangroviensis CBS 8507 TaxID=1296122 RepID=UPI00080D0F2A|nr:uncharacterized protein I203_08472 [Kwoniella mangroviensis CBS 8507]OCF62454.1 hypothetical protein I203_08472 [Kwoniella mangroviensis CBS 8507]
MELASPATTQYPSESGTGMPVMSSVASALHQQLTELHAGMKRFQELYASHADQLTKADIDTMVGELGLLKRTVEWTHRTMDDESAAIDSCVDDLIAGCSEAIVEAKIEYRINQEPSLKDISDDFTRKVYVDDKGPVSIQIQITPLLVDNIERRLTSSQLYAWYNTDPSHVPDIWSKFGHDTIKVNTSDGTNFKCYFGPADYMIAINNVQFGDENCFDTMKERNSTA